MLHFQGGSHLLVVRSSLGQKRYISYAGSKRQSYLIACDCLSAIPPRAGISTSSTASKPAIVRGDLPSTQLTAPTVYAKWQLTTPNVPIFSLNLITKRINVFHGDPDYMKPEHANIPLLIVFLRLDNNIHVSQPLNFDFPTCSKTTRRWQWDISLNQLFLLHTCCINEGEMYTRRLVFEK